MTVRLPLDLLAETPPSDDCRLVDLGERLGRWCSIHGQGYPCRWAIILWLRRLSPLVQTVIRKHATWRHLAGCEAEFAADPTRETDPETAEWLSACRELRQIDESAMEAVTKALVDAGLIEPEASTPVLMPPPHG